MKFVLTAPDTASALREIGVVLERRKVMVESSSNRCLKARDRHFEEGIVAGLREAIDTILMMELHIIPGITPEARADWSSKGGT